jgi:hypothetical protein
MKEINIKNAQKYVHHALISGHCDKEYASIEGISEEIENYCLNKAMDDAQKNPLLSRAS